MRFSPFRFYAIYYKLMNRLLKKISEARRARNRRAEAYVIKYVAARRLSATKPMRLFQQLA